jgi:DnaJ family protein A protein 2
MPSFRHHDFGNLYIQFDVKFPDKTELGDITLLEKVLPKRAPQIALPPDAMAEDYDLEDVDPHHQARAQGGAGMDDEDEDGIPQGAERMQCASQ